MTGRADECGAMAETNEDAAAQLRERASGARGATEPAAVVLILADLIERQTFPRERVRTYGRFA
ncbi:MAG: hypothetical protein WAN44_18485 [Propionibacteriaceae bacterium]